MNHHELYIYTHIPCFDPSTSYVQHLSTLPLSYHVLFFCVSCLLIFRTPVWWDSSKQPWPEKTSWNLWNIQSRIQDPPWWFQATSHRRNRMSWRRKNWRRSSMEFSKSDTFLIYWVSRYHPHKLCPNTGGIPGMPLSWGTWTSSLYIIVG